LGFFFGPLPLGKIQIGGLFFCLKMPLLNQFRNECPPHWFVKCPPKRWGFIVPPPPPPFGPVIRGEKNFYQNGFGGVKPFGLASQQKGTHGEMPPPPAGKKAG